MGAGGSTMSEKEVAEAKAKIAEMEREAQQLKYENEQLLAKGEAQVFTFGVSHGRGKLEDDLASTFDFVLRRALEIC